MTDLPTLRVLALLLHIDPANPDDAEDLEALGLLLASGVVRETDGALGPRRLRWAALRAAVSTQLAKMARVTEPNWQADHQRRHELVPIVGALLLHLHNGDGGAVRTLLEQEGFFDSPDQARQFVMATGETVLGLLGMLVGDQAELGRLLRTFTDTAHGA